ncbi:MAG: UDP-N-acetylmuramyl-tripeptide synthetase [Patescibacteria group bacterium]
MQVFITLGKKIIPKRLFHALQPLYHQLLAWLAAQWYRHPARSLLVIGITGTNGKSTVVEMTHRIFMGADVSVASISSLRLRINEKEERNEFSMTMPGRFALQRFLARAKKAGCRVAIIEVTSEGIAQSRHCGIDFDVAALTNITPEHIESHGSFEAYRNAKAELFKSIAQSFRKDSAIKKTIVVNGDDERAEYFLQFDADQKMIYLMTTPPQSPPMAIGGENEGVVVLTADQYEFDLKLPGAFNLANALCAAAIARSQGIPKEIIKKAIEGIKTIPGRMEYIQENPFAVIVDYAHTPDALEKMYETIKGNGRLICVLGAAGGGRDKWKRPELGRIASSYCDEIILTNEDPYDENPKEILHQIAQGLIPRFSRYAFILNRAEAIERALRAAQQGDVVMITGKGAEPWMHMEAGRLVKWDDREKVRETLEKIKKER